MRNMENKLSISKLELPSDWADDVRMNFLFSPFREKSVNPEGYDAKMKFWMNLIQELCIKCGLPVITQSVLFPTFERKGKYPQCLDVVMEHMLNQKLLWSLDEFSKIEQDKGWIGWGFDVLVQKPVSWGFSTVQNLMKSSKKDERFIVMSVIKDLCTKVLERHDELVSSELTDSVVFLDSFEAECKDICSDTNFDLVLVQLQKDKQVSVFEDRGKKVLKFRRKCDSKVQPLTELDRGILNLQTAKERILNDIDTLEEDIQSSTDEIKQQLKNSCKTKAMLSLKRKKRLEAVLKKKSISLDNIENLLCQLQNSSSEKMVLAAYKAGAQAIKASCKDELNLDHIDTTMAEVEGMLDDYAEVQKTLSRPVSSDDETLEQFEDELNQLLAAEKPAKESPRKEPSPAKVSDEDLFRRLNALRSPPEGVPPLKKVAMNQPLAS